MNYLSRDVLKLEDKKTEAVEVPEWGGSVLVTTMSGTDRDAWEASIVEVKGTETKQNFKNLRAKLVARTVVDADGKRLFSDGDIDELGSKSAIALDRIFRVAQKLNGIGRDAVDELTKN